MLGVWIIDRYTTFLTKENRYHRDFWVGKIEDFFFTISWTLHSEKHWSVVRIKKKFMNNKIDSCLLDRPMYFSACLFCTVGYYGPLCQTGNQENISVCLPVHQLRSAIDEWISAGRRECDVISALRSIAYHLLKIHVNPDSGLSMICNGLHLDIRTPEGWALDMSHFYKTSLRISWKRHDNTKPAADRKFR